MTNDGNLTITDTTVTDERTGLSEKIESLAPGASVEYETKTTVTEADILSGHIINDATAKGTSPDPDKPDVPVEPGHTDDEPEDLDTTLTVNKTISSQPADGKAYQLGETIEYTITVTNDGNATYYNVKVEDKDTGFTTTIDSLAVGATETFTTSHVVNEEDILAGSYTNTVTAKGDPIDDPKDPENPKTPEGEDSTTTGDEDDPDGPTPPIVDPNPHMTINKVTTSTAAAADGKYALGETITYEITATNDGNLTLTNVVVTDELTGDEWTLQSLAPNASETFEASYTVTEADVLAGTVVNVATGKADNPDPEIPETPVVPGTDPEPTEDPKPHMTITKITTSTPDNGTGYALGETISYQITAENDGNLTLTNVKVNDELTGDAWTVDSMAPGEKRTFTAQYTVTEQDILAGEVVNVATGEADNPDPEIPETPVVPGTDPEPTDDIDPSMTVVKTVTSTPAEGEAYALGETVDFQIVVTNTGNVPYTNVKVTDDLTGDSWTIASLAVGASETFTTSYVVTADDAEAGSFTNVAVAVADPIPDPKNPTDPKVPGNNGTREVPTTDDTIAGDTTYYDLVIRYLDEDGNLINTYEANLKEGTAYNVKSPAIEGFTPDMDVVAGTLNGDTNVDVIYSRNSYTLTIRYLDMNGNVIATTYRKVFFYGDRYSVKSPAVAGYEAVRGTVTGTMPARNVQITVRYNPLGQPPVEELETISDYATPLGLGNVVMNSGDCFE